MLAAVCNHFTRAADGQSLPGSGNVCNKSWIVQLGERRFATTAVFQLWLYVNSSHGTAMFLYPTGGGDDGVPRYFFIVAYPDREFDDPDGTLLPGDEAAINHAQRLAEELREDRQPGEPDMTMIVKNAEGVVIYSAPV
jgi:hypothetical protein